MKKILLFSICVLFTSFNSLASCTLDGSIQNLTFNFIQNHVTVGSDSANGTIVLSQNNQARTTNQTVKCTEAGQFYINRNYESGASLIPSGVVGAYNSPVYKTNVQGLGFYYYSVSKPLDSSNSSAVCSQGVTTCTFTPSQSYIGVRIIKIGNVVPGSILKGSDLPCAVINAGLTGSMVTVKKICVNGNIIIDNLTCNTPANIDVSLGKHKISDFSGVNSTTSWTDASIKLTNCPPFKGYAISGHSYDDGSMSGISNGKNRLSLALNPINGVSDAANGIITLSNSSTASGIGIQMASGTMASATLLNFNNSVQSSIDLPYTSSVSELTFPLVARYIQINNNIKPGSANGQVIYTINYY